MAWTELPNQPHLDLMSRVYQGDNGWLLCYVHGLRYLWVLDTPDHSQRYINADLSRSQIAEAQTWADSLVRSTPKRHH